MMISVLCALSLAKSSLADLSVSVSDSAEFAQERGRCSWNGLGFVKELHDDGTGLTP